MKPFLTAVLQTAEVLSVTLSPQKQAGYWLALQDLPLDAFQAACVEVMRRETFFPAPVIFREYATAWRKQQRMLAPARQAELLALREELIPHDEIQALIAGIWKHEAPTTETPA